MTPMQHRAVLVCVLCVLAVLLTFGITTTLLKKEESAPSVPESVADPAPGKDLSSHYQIDNTSAALLTETADAGTDYLPLEITQSAIVRVSALKFIATFTTGSPQRAKRSAYCCKAICFMAVSAF